MSLPAFESATVQGYFGRVQELTNPAALPSMASHRGCGAVAAMSPAEGIAVAQRLGLIERLRNGIDVLDIGSAAGTLVELAATFPISSFFAYEQDSHALEAARAEIARRRLRNITVMRQDATTFPDSLAYDLVTAFDTVRDHDCPIDVLANIHRALRPGGTFVMRDIAGTGRLLDMLAQAGFHAVTVRRLPHDILNFYYVASKRAGRDRHVLLR